MLIFWANIDESDVEGFAGTLLLPSYMSHLTLSPFRIGDQPHNFDGLQPFILTYTGQGRVEQLAVAPQKHALQLLRYAVPALDFDWIRLSTNGAIWNWDVPAAKQDFASSRQESSKESSLLKNHSLPEFRIYFEAIFHSLQSGSQKNHFSPFQTYVSVSRKEMFIGSQILAAYFQAWINRLLRRDSFPFKTPFCEESQKQILPKNSSREFWDNPAFALNLTSNRVRFAMQNIGGEWSVEEDDVFFDLLEFAGLKPPLKEIEQYAIPDLGSPKTQIGEVGILFQLTEPP